MSSVEPQPKKDPSAEYDVIVVGAGFGGPVAAKKCADAGLRTLLLERAENPGEKVISGLTIPFYGFLFGPAFIRDGNPPIERPADGIINYIITDIDSGRIDIDDSLIIPKPLSPIIAFGYNAYCRPFCQWETDRAVESGVEVRTSTAAADVIKRDGCVQGIITEDGDLLGAKVVIDAEGSQGLLAIRAGIREKYTPESISLADVYDYEMPREDIDRVFGHTLRFCWGWDEQRIAPPLGYGNGLMVWPYRDSLHFIQDQCLTMNEGKVPDLKGDFKEYHRNITSKLPWWREEVAPRIKLRAKMFDSFEIYVGLDEYLSRMRNHTDGMILVGDAAGLEGTELCDGVPAAWFSAEIAADVAIEAIESGDTSSSSLRKFDERVKAHPLIQWSISRTNRYELRETQRKHDEKILRTLIHNGWGLGAFTHASTPLLRTILDSISDEPAIIVSWIRMFFRYYYNWHYGRFGGRSDLPATPEFPSTRGQRAFKKALDALDGALRSLSSPLSKVTSFLAPLSRFANPLVSLLLPLVEPLYEAVVRLAEPLTDSLSRRTVEFVEGADPGLFDHNPTEED